LAVSNPRNLRFILQCIFHQFNHLNLDYEEE
jgi:hypothetical protein